MTRTLCVMIEEKYDFSHFDVSCVGALALWDIHAALVASTSPTILTPMRLFHPADAVSKQPRFGWGHGWIAVRAVIWSPFDPYLVASVSNVM